MTGFTVTICDQLIDPKPLIFERCSSTRNSTTGPLKDDQLIELWVSNIRRWRLGEKQTTDRERRCNTRVLSSNYSANLFVHVSFFVARWSLHGYWSIFWKLSSFRVWNWHSNRLYMIVILWTYFRIHISYMYTVWSVKLFKILFSLNLLRKKNFIAYNSPSTVFSV